MNKTIHYTLTIIVLALACVSTHAAEAPIGLHLAFVVLYPFWTLSFLGLLTAFAFRRWNKSKPLNRELAAHSYNMYLVHYAFVMTLPPLLGRWAGGPALVKFGIVTLLTIVLSYGFSRYVLKPYPRLVTLGLVGTSALLAILV